MFPDLYQFLLEFWMAFVEFIMAIWNQGTGFLVQAFNQILLMPYAVLDFFNDRAFEVMYWVFGRLPESGPMIPLPDFPNLAATPFGFVLGSMHVLFDLGFVIQVGAAVFFVDNLILVIALIRWIWGWIVG